MAMDFGWWKKTPEDGKFQVNVRWHGGNLSWTKKQGHHSSWEEFAPVAEDLDQLMHEADRRVPRRLISPRQYADLKAAVERARM